MMLRPLLPLGVPGLGGGGGKGGLRFLVQNYYLFNFNWLFTKLTGVTAVGQQIIYL